MESYRKLSVYQKSYQLALELYQLSKKLPRDTQFDLADQLRRASRSIPTNIAEGYGRKSSSKGFCHFLRIALGSKDEMSVHLDFLKDLNYIDQKTYEHYFEKNEEIGKMLFGLIKSLSS